MLVTTSTPLPCSGNCTSISNQATSVGLMLTSVQMNDLGGCIVTSFPTEICARLTTILSERLSKMFSVDLDKLQPRKEKCAFGSRPGDHSHVHGPSLKLSSRSCNKVIIQFFSFLNSCGHMHLTNSKFKSEIQHSSQK